MEEDSTSPFRILSDRIRSAPDRLMRRRKTGIKRLTLHPLLMRMIALTFESAIQFGPQHFASLAKQHARHRTPAIPYWHTPIGPVGGSTHDSAGLSSAFSRHVYAPLFGFFTRGKQKTIDMIIRAKIRIWFPSKSSVNRSISDELWIFSNRWPSAGREEAWSARDARQIRL